MSVLVLVATHVLAAAAGAFAWPHVSTLFAGWSAGRAVKAAEALIAKAEADAKALEAARKVVATKPVAIGATGGHA